MLPSPNGSLSKIVPSTSISIVNREVKTLKKLAYQVPNAKINIHESPKIVHSQNLFSMKFTCYMVDWLVMSTDDYIPH